MIEQCIFIFREKWSHATFLNNLDYLCINSGPFDKLRNSFGKVIDFSFLEEW
jgi:hypothetical protein